MSGRFRPEAGADSEPIHWQDTTCDYCGRTEYAGMLRRITIARSTSYLCNRCYDRQQERFRELDA